MEGKGDMTSKDTMHSSGSIWFMSIFVSISTCRDWQLRSFSLEKNHSENLYVDDSIKDAMILKDVCSLWILGGPYARPQWLSEGFQIFI